MKRYGKNWTIVLLILIGMRLVHLLTGKAHPTFSAFFFMAELGGFLVFIGVNYFYFKKNNIKSWGVIFKHILQFTSPYILIGGVIQIATLSLLIPQATSITALTYVAVLPYMVLLNLSAFVLYLLLKFIQ